MIQVRKFVSSDKIKMEVPMDAGFHHSGLIQRAIERQKPSKPILLPKPSDILKLCFNYMEMHKSDPPYVQVDKLNDYICKEQLCDRNFILGLTNEVILDVIMAADVLEMPGLIDLGCRGIALRMEDKTAYQIQEDFNL
jgi:hypothetical protein